MAGRGFKIADAWVEISVDKDALRDGVKDIPRAVGPEADRAGREMGKRVGKGLGDESKRQGEDAGGKLAVGMRMSIVRNSPVIVAAVAGGLIAGAPAVLAASTAMFAGIGIAAAAQNDEVKAAFAGLRNLVKDSAAEIGQPLADILPSISDKIGAAFLRMKPQIVGAMEAVAPQVEVFARGITNLAENAMPGLVRSVEAGMPVTRGLADFLGKVGTGLSDFFDRITAHGPAAGQVWSQLGDTFATILPTLGELLGQGVELASMVLPLLNSSLGLVLDVATALGPALPAIAAGFAGMQIAQAASGWIGGLADKMSGFYARVSESPGVMGKMNSAVGGIVNALGGPWGVALAGAGTLVGLFTADIQENNRVVDGWAGALREGGAAARQAMQEAAAEADKYSDNWVGSLSRTLDQWAGLSPTIEEAEAANRDYFASLDPITRAAERVTQAENDLAFALEEHGSGSDEARHALQEYEGAVRVSESANRNLEEAINGVSQAMIDQTNQALSAIDSGFAYQNALDGLEDSQLTLTEAIKGHGTASEEASDAERAFAEDLFRTAQAAGQHQADISGLEEGTAEYARTVQTQALAELYRLRDAFPQMSGPINEMIGRLEASGVSLDELGEKHPMPTVDADTGPLDAKYSSAMNVLGILGGQRPMPSVRLDDSQLQARNAAVTNTLDILSGKRPMPIATLFAQTGSAEAALNLAARNRSSTVYQNVVQNVSRFITGITPYTGGQIGDLPLRTKRMSTGGQVRGPGGPTDDAVGPFSSSRADVWLSNEEWVIKALSARKYGDKLMAAVNAGTATITAPGVPTRGLALGGEVSERPPMAESVSSPGAAGLSRANINITIATPLNLMNDRDVRRAATMLRAEIIKLERAQS